jgi:hypothetical protein
MNVGQLKVHALAHPALLAEHSDYLERRLRAELRLTDRSRFPIVFSATSGWLSVRDERVIEAGGGPAAVPAAVARTSAEGAGRGVVRALSGAREPLPEPLQGVRLVPSLLPTEFLRLAPPPGVGGSARWLYRASAELGAFRDRGDRVPVLGGVLEVVLGAGAALAWLQLRWRATTAEIRYADPCPEPAVEGGRDPPRLVYRLPGDGVPEYYLAPYYLVDAAEGEVASACAWALTARIALVETARGPLAVALIEGGSGSYEARWATGPIGDADGGPTPLERASDFPDPGRRGLAHPACRVPREACEIYVNVQDRVTGAFIHHRQFLFPPPDFTSGAGLVA